MIICMKTRINVFLIKKMAAPMLSFSYDLLHMTSMIGCLDRTSTLWLCCSIKGAATQQLSRLVRQSSVGSAALSWCSELDKRVRWYGKGNYGSTRKSSSFYCRATTIYYRSIYNHYVNANVLYIHAGDDTNVALWRHVAIIHYLPDPTVEPVLRTRDVKCTLYISTSIRYVKWNFEV